MKKVKYILYKVKVWVLCWFYVVAPGKGTYRDLYCYKNVWGNEGYLRMKNRIFQRVERKIRRKSNKVIRIILPDSTEWCTTAIYHALHKMGMDVAVILTPYLHGTEDNIRRAYELCRDFCEARKIRYFEIYDTENWNCIAENKQKAKGDIIIYINPWMGAYPEESRIGNMPLLSITCYIPYGFVLGGDRGSCIAILIKVHSICLHIYFVNRRYIMRCSASIAI